MAWRRLLLSIALVGGSVWCLAAVQQVHSEVANAEKASSKRCYEPVASVHDIMEDQEHHWSEMLKHIRARKADPDNKEASKTIKENYKLIQRHAYLLAELANVNHYQSDKEDYMQWAHQMRDTCVAVAQAAKAEDLAKTDSLTRQVHTVCGNCHEKYRD